MMQDFLGHIDKVNPKVNAILSRVDHDVMIDKAKMADKQLLTGKSSGWMHGFPHAVKDLAYTTDIKTTYGSPLFKDYLPKEDQLIVQRMREAGALFLGKTNVPEFGLGCQTYNTVFGTTANAYDTSKTASGSSGGAACALATRMVPVADGSDMAGSLRNPASFNNVIGFRSSFGSIPFLPAGDVWSAPMGIEGQWREM